MDANHRSVFSHYRIHTEWKNTVNAIRKLPGLHSFLLPPSFEDLRQASEKGPVVIININKRRSDAIVIVSSGEPIVVPLLKVNPEVANALANHLGERPAECHQSDVIFVLREAWRIIVEPVVRVLRESGIALPQGSRIWWCPIGASSRLPLHAAGPYIRGERNLPHIFISSYTPTLGALIRARQARSAPLEKPTKTILVVGQPDTPFERPLPKVLEEVQAIRDRAPAASVLQSSGGSKEAVLKGLGEHAWLHLACHGHHDDSQPFRSSFSMYDAPITLLDLIAKDLPHAELAVLSACHSARVNETLPDEALHPAAGMMFAGYKSVIGTMWALDDGLGAALASKFYKSMLGRKSGPRDYSEAAVVLAKAFETLDKEGHSISFTQRINVVHYGV